MIDTLFLFAAGFGKRMAPLTDSTPKPLIKVNGIALIDHALNLARDAGIKRIFVNLHYLPEQIEAHLAGSGVVILRETPDILETGGALKAALHLIGDAPIMTLNTDAVWCGANPLTLLQQTYQPAMAGLQMVVPTSRAIGHVAAGDWNMVNTRLKRGTEFVYGGAQIINTGGLSLIAERIFSLNRLWDQMIAVDALFGQVYPGQWCDVGRPESIELAEAMLTEHV